MRDLVTFFPDWRGDPYINRLLDALAAEGWRTRIVGRKRLALALAAAILGRGTVHLHWYEGFNPGRGWIHGLIAWLHLPLLWLAGRRGRLIWTVHNVTPHEGYAPLVGTRFLRLLARSSSRILVHFEDTRAVLARRFAASDRVFVTPPPSFRHAHGPPIDRPSARARVGAEISDGTMLFVQIGSLRRYKQPVATILAFRDAATASSALVVAGPCNDEALKAEMAQAARGDPRVVLTFRLLSDVDLVAALCAADWSICPYEHIDNPGALNLIVSYNCPVIAPALPAVRMLTSGHRSILYPVDGPTRQCLADAITLALTGQAPTASASRADYVVDTREQARQIAKHYLAARVSRA